MKLQGKKTGAFADFIGWTDSAAAPIDLEAGSRMLTVHYKDAGKDVYADYKTLAGLNADWEDYIPDEPTTQQLEDSIKELDERLKTVEKLLKISGVGFCLIHNQDKPCKDCIRKIIEQIKKKNGEDYTPDELLITGEAGK